MKLIFIFGLPGVGKFTVGKELSRQTGLKLFHNHMVLDLVIDIFGKHIPSIIRLRERIWLDFFKEAAKQNMEGVIFTFCFDKYLSRNFLKKVEYAVGPSGVVCYTRLTCSDDILKERIKDPSRNEFNKMQDFNSLMQQVKDKSFYVPRLKRNTLEIDNTHLSPSEAATIISRQYYSL